METNRIRTFGVIAGLVVLSFPFWLTPLAIEFKDDALEEIIPTLSFLFVVALFMERSIEVFLSAWRSTEADNQDFLIAKQTKLIKAKKTTLEASRLNGEMTNEIESEISSLETTLSTLADNRIQYRAQSRCIALWFGLALGLLLAAVGIRTLHNFVDPTAFDSLKESYQAATFTVVDVLLTGSLLSGGSEAINKLMKIYTNFTQATADKAKGNKP